MNDDTTLTLEKLLATMPDLPPVPYGYIVAPADVYAVRREVSLLRWQPAIGVCVHQEPGTVKACATHKAWKAQLVACGCW